MQDVLLSNGTILIFMTIIVIIGIIYCYCRESLSYYADERSPELEVIIFMKNAQNEVEGIVRDYYKKEVKPRELWIVDCGSRDQTTQILQRLSRQFLELRLLFLSDMPFAICVQEALKLINAPALLLIDGTNLRCKDVLELTNLLHAKKNVAIGLKSYKK